MNTEKAVEKIKECAFDTDTEQNIARSKMLCDIRVGIFGKRFELFKEYEKKKNELVLTEEVQKGKNAETRQAIIELELAGTNFDKIKEYDYLLAIVHSTEKHNENVLALIMSR